METIQEETFIRTFIIKQKQDRYLQFLPHPKRRQKAFESFYHTLETVPAWTVPVASRNNFPDPLEKMLRNKGAGPLCYVISPDEEIDQREMLLREALETVIMQDTVAVLSCIPGHLAYYKAEHEAYVLENTSAKAGKS